jgi:hypothetical protein
MKFTLSLLTAAALSCFAVSASAQIATFDFTGGSLADSAETANLIVSDISSAATGGTDGFNSFTDSSGWDSAAQISGASSFFSAPTSQATAGDAIVFTIGVTSGFEFSITGFSFDARSTGTAPADIGFTIDGTSYDFSGSYTNDSVITTISSNSLSLTGQTSTITISIQGWNATGSGALQIDNISVAGLVSAVPEPGTYALLAGCCALGFVMVRRRQ